MLKHFTKKLLSIAALSISELATSLPWVKVGIDLTLLLRNFIAFQNFFGSLGFNLKKYRLLAESSFPKVLLRARLYFEKSPVRLACLKSLFLLRIDWTMDLLSHGRFRLLFNSVLGMVCFMIDIKMRCQDSQV